MWALTPRPDATDLWTLRVPDRLALVLGAEGPGLSPAAIDAASREVRIPIAPDVDSLNVAAAAAVAFAAIAREPRCRSETYCWSREHETSIPRRGRGHLAPSRGMR